MEPIDAPCLLDSQVDADGDADLEKGEKDGTEGMDQKGERMLWTVFNVCNNVIGIGMLEMSRTLSETGIVLGLFVIVIMAILQVVCGRMTLQAIDSCHADGLDDAAAQKLGCFGGTAYSVIVIMHNSFSMMSYMILGANMLEEWTNGSRLDYDHHQWLRAWTVVAFASVQIALSLPRSLSFLGRASVLSVVAAVLVDVALSVRVHPVRPPVLVRWSGRVADVVAIASMAFAIPVSIYPLVRDVRGGLQSQVGAVSLGVALSCVIALICAVTGYLRWGDDVCTAVLDSFANGDILVSAARAGFFVKSALGYPSQHAAAACSWSKLLFGKNNFFEVTGVRRAAILLLTNVWIVACGVLLPEVKPAYEIGGAIGGCLGNLTLPAWLFLACGLVPVHGVRWWASVAIIVFGVACASVAGYYAVYDAIQAFGHKTGMEWCGAAASA